MRISQFSEKRSGTDISNRPFGPASSGGGNGEARYTRAGLPAYSELNQLSHAIQHLCGTLDVDVFVLDQDWKNIRQPG